MIVPLLKRTSQIYLSIWLLCCATSCIVSHQIICQKQQIKQQHSCRTKIVGCINIRHHGCYMKVLKACCENQINRLHSINQKEHQVSLLGLPEEQLLHQSIQDPSLGVNISKTIQSNDAQNCIYPLVWRGSFITFQTTFLHLSKFKK